MEKLDRRALKDRFKKGKMPSENDFSNLIDSMINILEEGFDKTSDDGLKVAQLMGSGKLISFYENIAVDSPQWFLELGIGDNKLHFGTVNTPHVLSLRSYEERQNGDISTKVAVGINKELPRTTLDVDGTVAATGRCGQPGDMPVLADGEWHDITPSLTGCEAFEIVAGVGGKDSDGKYALVRATALNTFNGKSSIDQQPAYFGSKCNRIELRWASVPEQGPFYYKLQMRVQCAYFASSDKNKIWVKYHIMRLWFDSMMVDSPVES